MISVVGVLRIFNDVFIISVNLLNIKRKVNFISNEIVKELLKYF